MTRVSLHNSRELARLGIEAGSEVEIALAGDVIPEVVEVVGAKSDLPWTPAAMPAPAIDACLDDAPDCRERFIARAVHFTSKNGLDIAGLGPGRIRMLVEAELVDELPGFFALEEEEIAGVPGFGEKSARQLIAAIQASTHPPVSRLVAALGIPGVGQVTSGRLGEHFRTLDDLMSANETELIALPGIGPATAKNIRSFFHSPGGSRLMIKLRKNEIL